MNDLRFPHAHLNRFIPVTFPLLLFILSFSLRFSLISRGSFELDCLEMALKAQQTSLTGELHYMHAPGYPLAVLLGVFFIRILNLFSITDPVFSVNLMSVCFGSVNVALQYLLTKNLFNEKAAVFSAVMFCFVPVLFLQSLFGISLTIFLSFLLLGLYGMTLDGAPRTHVRGVAEATSMFTDSPLEAGNRCLGGSIPPRRPFTCFTGFCWRDKKGIKTVQLLLSGLCFGLASAIREQDFILMFPAIFYVFLTKNKDDPLRKKIYSFMAFGGMIFLVGLLFHLPYVLGGQQKTYRVIFLDNFDYYVAKSFLGIISARFPSAISELTESLTPLGMIIALTGMAKLWLKDRRVFLFLLLWIAMPLLFYGNARTASPLRYLSIIIPAFLIFQSCIFQYSFKNAFYQSIKIIVFVSMIALLYGDAYPLARLRHQSEVLPDFARWVANKTEPDAKIIASDERLFLEYYGQRQALGRPMSVYGISEEQLLEFKTKLDKMLDQGVPVYITSSSLWAYNKNNRFSDFMNKYYEGEFVGKHPYEDWHLGAAKKALFNSELYRIRKRIMPLH